MRKTAMIAIDAEGRDKGKVFLIEEMSAYDAEKWAWAVVAKLGATGIDIGELGDQGMAGLARMGIEAFFRMPPEDSWDLSERLMSCVMILPHATDKTVKRALTGDDIEETSTRLRLKWEVFSLHTGFSVPGVRSTSTPETPQTSTSPATQTSQLPSGRSSRVPDRARQRFANVKQP